ncbi:UNVERIFIED_CONTAM: Retrovirus-related Pol polyprotein from transposon [Sesamum angustifolium]|uniref:Retrovirus-related Pol polyprotein from transposon n=1 Tax=Sesamum angustifolium TaxID=2727405 RepID=A0AAW2MJU6_9LAMI
MESTKFVRLGTLGSISVHSGSGQQTLAFHCDECLGYGTTKGVYTVFTLFHAGVNPKPIPCRHENIMLNPSKKERREGTEEPPEIEDPNKRGKDPVPSPKPDEETSATVQPVEELLTIELAPSESREGYENRIQDDQKGPKSSNHLPSNEQRYLCVDSPRPGGDRPRCHHTPSQPRPRVKPVKQKKQHFGPEIDKIIQGEVNKLLSARYIKEIQFPEWLSNVVLIPKSGGKWRMCIDFWDLNKACPKDFYPLLRIDQLVDSMSGCELLSMMDASQGYHQIMLAPENYKRVSFITSYGTFCYVAMLFRLKNAGATYQRLVDKIFRPQLGRNMEV